jgi:hypothetical protein
VSAGITLYLSLNGLNPGTDSICTAGFAQKVQNRYILVTFTAV